MKATCILATAVIVSLGTGACAYATGPMPAQESTLTQESGGPPPDFVMHQEEARKQRTPANDHRSDQNAQVTLGGAKSVVFGEVFKVDGERYFVKDEDSGDEVRLLVNKDTNVDCGEAATIPEPGLIGKQPGSLDPGASARQISQGQRKDETAIGSGFRIGWCSFQAGDRVKAEVSDTGIVTTLKLASNGGEAQPRSIGRSAGTGELAMPQQEKPGQLDMTGAHGYPPKQYVILPVPRGNLVPTRDHTLIPSPVKSPDGKTLGTLVNLIMDSNTGQVEYADVLLADTAQVVPVPWIHFKISQHTGALVLNTTHYQLEPAITRKDVTDRSPAIDQFVKDMESARAPADLLRPGESPKRSAAAEGLQSKRSGGQPGCGDGVKCELLKGQVIQVQDQFIEVKDGSSKEVRLYVDRNTDKGQVNIKDGSFKVGDTIEAYVTPTGYAQSITLTREQAGMPDDPES